MKRAVILSNIFFLLAVTVFTQQKVKYFQIDKVKTFRGEITEIKREKSYSKDNFIILFLKVKDKTGDEIYRVEVSPEWFFVMDLLKGSKVEITGSYSKIHGQSFLMTQSITFMGERYKFRDKNGFPLWRGKGKLMKGSFRGKGKRKQRVNH
jgi:hypothetical protein